MKQIIPPKIVDHKALVRARQRGNAKLDDDALFLRREIADRLVDRLRDIKGDFPRVLDIGFGCGELYEQVKNDADLCERIGYDGWHGIEPCVDGHSGHSNQQYSDSKIKLLDMEDEVLGVQNDGYDLVLSNLFAHSVNDMVGLLIQSRMALKPKGMILFSLFGAGCLDELRTSFVVSESQQQGGLSSRFLPLIGHEALGGLLQRAQFSLPVIDRDTITVNYRSGLQLMKDLKNMGENNYLESRSNYFMRRGVLIEALNHYQQNYSDSDGHLLAHFEIMYLHGIKGIT